MNYMYHSDVEGKQFNAIRPVWGFSQVLPLDTFNDPKNGYVFEGDQCEFGVDVMVPLVNWEVVSFPMKPPDKKFSWTLKKFSKLKDHCYVSDTFIMGGKNGVIKLYPKGYTTTYSKSLSMFVFLADSETMKAVDNRYNYDNRTQGWGWYHFIYLDKLREAYLDKEDSLQVDIEFAVVSTTTSSP
ncbi:PREDICTED: ubiquitin carboxyl-terminal hydrolase 13-like [Camelina sativa]|uniref:Ubiquitin carboxyl-terminal hydrolase 13-like n=1 Tax=Camelina sativa TaxID=90675 RepID=A0ABM0T591_CAMSA|nr:PREDICTED: ubiquitin carboxyl-terminal hydrolase 13-like [Camelina sativa]